MTQRRISAAAKRRICRRNRNIAPHRRMRCFFSGAFTLGRYISCGVPTGERGRNCGKRASNGRPYDLTLVRASPVFQGRIKITSIYFLRRPDRKPWRKPQDFWRTCGKRNAAVYAIASIPGNRKICTALTLRETPRFMPCLDTGLPQNLHRTHVTRNVTVSTIVSIPGHRKICTALTLRETSRFLPMSRYRAAAINVSVLCPFAIKKRAQIKNLRSLLTFVLAFSFDRM